MTKLPCLFICLLNCFQVFAQGNQLDAFDTMLPYWQYSKDDFKVSNGKLQSSSTVVDDTFSISKFLEVQEKMEWRLKVSLDFPTSSRNYVDFWLLVQQLNSHEAPVGTFIRIGGAKDKIALMYRDSMGEDHELGSSEEGVTHQFNQDIRVLKNKDVFQVYTNEETHNWRFLFAGSQSCPSSMSLSGISVRQSTSSFHKKHVFDDYYGGPRYQDHDPPKMVAWSVHSSGKVDMIFSEPIDTFDFKGSFVLSQSRERVKVVVKSASFLELHFTDYEKGLYQQLTISGIRDTSGNEMEDTMLTFRIVPEEEAAAFSLLFTEVMPDPSPSIDLPEVEFIEVYNPGQRAVRASNYFLSDPTIEVQLPDVILPPESFAVLVRQSDTAFFDDGLLILGLDAFPNLNNDGDSLRLRSRSGKTVDFLFYGEDWHNPEWKKFGGWSLERKGLTSQCLQKRNWVSSTSLAGGTPAAANSVFAELGDTEPPIIRRVWMPLPSVVELELNEHILSYVPSGSHFEILRDGKSIFLLETTRTSTRSLKLRLEEELQVGEVIQLHVTGIHDCNGNRIQDTTLLIGIPKKPEVGDFLLNEILFNPHSDEPKWIEVYNQSSAILNWRDVRIGTRYEQGMVRKWELITQQDVYAYPKEYFVLTDDKKSFLKAHPEAINIWVIEVSSFPTMGRDAGGVVLGLARGEVLDEIRYSEDQHGSWIVDPKGVSLERISHDKGSLDNLNWTSAASPNYSTPTFPNSQRLLEVEEEDWLTVGPDPFTPNGDGVQDVVQISFRCAPGSLYDVEVYDQLGQRVCQIASADLSGTENSLTWDGRDSNGRTLLKDTYIIWVNILEVDGTRKTGKKVVTLIPR
jgi:hypothetical protein